MSPEVARSLEPDDKIKEPPFFVELLPPERVTFPPGKYPDPASSNTEPPVPCTDEPDFALIIPPVDLTDLPSVSPVFNSISPESPLTLEPV